MQLRYYQISERKIKNSCIFIKNKLKFYKKKIKIFANGGIYQFEDI